jgi:hypothetical protein
MRTVTVVPKVMAVTNNNFKYSPHGAILPNSKIEKTDRYTWELNNNGSITYGLGRQPVDSVDEAILVAKGLEKLGYTYKGVRG